jgi:hypothetical protein
LREPLGDIGSDAAGVLANELDLDFPRTVAVLCHIQLDAVIHLRCGVSELAGIGHDEADLYGVLSVGSNRAQEQRE